MAARTEPITVGKPPHAYRWQGDWARVPEDIQLGYTHGVCVDAQGLVYVFNQSQHGVVIFEPDGRFAGTWDEFPSERFVGAHGLTLVDNGGDQHLWLTDQDSGEVVKTTLTGQTVLKLAMPDHPAYAEGGKYSPTWAAETADGTVYVADGYGQSLVHVYDAEGEHQDSYDGTAGIGRFDCPHGLAILSRTAATGRHEPVLYVTDRANHRVVVFDLQMKFIKAWYQDAPCCFAQGPDDELLVPDLLASIMIYDHADQPVAPRLGDNQNGVVGQHGWPNVPHEMRVAGKFNSPHGGCFDYDGNIYIVEWIEDGRVTKLVKQG
jgi:hypothetical protein